MATADVAATPSSSFSAPASATASASRSSSARAARAPFRSLFLHTHDVSRSLKPSADGELAHALHQTLHFALDGDEDDWGIQQLGKSGGCDPLATMPSTSDSTHTNDGSATLSAPAAHSHATATTNGTGSISSSSSSAGAPHAGQRARPGFFATQDPDRPFVSYLWSPSDSTLTLPNPSTINNPVADPCSPDLRSAYEITGKFFYLSESTSTDGARFPPEWIHEAFQRLTKTTGLITLDTLTVAFPTLDLDGLKGRALMRTHSRPGAPNGTRACAPCSEGEATAAPSAPAPSAEGVSEQQKADLAHVAKVWQSISMNPQFLSLGLSDVSQPALEYLFGALDPPLPIRPPTTDSAPSSSSPLSTAAPTTTTPETRPTLSASREQAAADLAPYSIPSASRHPRVVSINVSTDPCGFDRRLSAWCQRQEMLLIAHSDRRDVLPSRTLPTLLKEFHDALPHPLPYEGATLKPKWVLKYTTLIRDRGVLADKGYLLFAEVE